MIDASGQWKDTERGTVVREPSKVVLITFKDDAAKRADLSAIAEASQASVVQAAVGDDVDQDGLCRILGFAIVDATPACVAPRRIPARAGGIVAATLSIPESAPGLAAQQPRQRHPAAGPQANRPIASSHRRSRSADAG